VPDVDRDGADQGEQWTESKYGEQNGHVGPISTQVSSVLEAFVPETRRPLGHGRFATACCSTRAVAPVDVFGDPVRASSWAALESRPQGRRHDWADSLRRRREPCEEARAELHSPPNHVGCCPILSAEIPARPTAAVTITPSHHQSSPRQVSSLYATLV
jgi:hypothetical protein